MYSLSEKVWWFSLLSRLFVLTLSALANVLLPNHEPGVFLSPKDPLDTRKSVADDVVEVLFGGLLRWDAQYFLHIAKYGYTYENCLAFFPLYPLLVRYFALLLHHALYSVLSYHSVVTISAVIINLVAFVQSAVVLFRLGLCVLKDEAYSYKAAILYCVNPASIFFSAPYSESLFALLTFYGMLKCVKTKGGEELSLQCGLLFGLSAVCRSNGLLNVGFIVYEKLVIFIQFISLKFVHNYIIIKNSSILMLPLLMFPFIVSLISFILTTLLSLIPFIGFQMYGYDKFCSVHRHNLPQFITAYAKANRFKLPGVKRRNSLRHWCASSIPLAYSYVQQHYWDVGFLRYYHWKQIPNFLLAFPMAVIILYYSVKYLNENRQHFLCSLMSVTRHKKDEEKEKVSTKSKFCAAMFVFIVHALFVTCFCILCIHVQVTTRLVASASPILYWFTSSVFPSCGGSAPSDRLAAHLSCNTKSRSSKQFRPEVVETTANLNSWWKVFILSRSSLPIMARVVRVYFFFYLVTGTVLFSNFYPWT
ncbi:GPI mannosyltransferase 2 [Bacillus rossius redtenbacheri]|uniref:GPI mannosyltransferase 2 n=1 Tax=Bacillus rossius redtenbacheri TaxID=93214 RepID=UPI002FDCB79C